MCTIYTVRDRLGHPLARQALSPAICLRVMCDATMFMIDVAFVLGCCLRQAELKATAPTGPWLDLALVEKRQLPLLKQSLASIAVNCEEV